MAKRWTEDLGAWASSLRFSGFTVLIVGLVIAGAFIVSPSLSTFVQQQREISELRQSVAEHRESVNDIDGEREKWKDPAYVRSQARDRLFYVMPGETQLNVIDDVIIPPDTDEQTSSDLTHIDQSWADSLVKSVLTAGTPEATPADDAAADADEQTSGENAPADQNDKKSE